MENESNNENQIVITKKALYIGGGVLAVILLIISGFFIFKGKKEPKNPEIASKIDSSKIKKDSIKNNIDSTKTTNNYAEEGEEESPYSDYRVIIKSLALPSRNLAFGDLVFVDESRSTETKKIIYLENPNIKSNLQPYEIDASYFISNYQFDDYKKNFSLAPFSGLAPGVKKILLEENYNDGTTYRITQNAERAKSSVAFGDFDGDGIKDVAVILDNNDKQVSRLLIICTNVATKMPYTAFSENYTDKIKINSFKKNAKVFMDSEDLVSSPQDGIIGKSEEAKFAVIYNSELQKFKTYYQE